MRILWVTSYPYPYGKKYSHPAPWTKLLADAIVNEENCELTILSTSSSLTKPVEKFKIGGLNFIYLKIPNSYADLLTNFYIRLNIIKKNISKILNEYDLVHIHGTEYQYDYCLKGAEIPTIISIQGIISECIKVLPSGNFKTRWRWLLSSYYEKRTISDFNNFICRTHWDSNFIKTNVKKPRIFNIWEMIREPFFQVNSLVKKNNILFLGGTNPIKGFDKTLLLLNELRKEMNVNLIMGGYVDNKKIKAFINKNKLKNISDSIILTGVLSVKEIIENYEKSLCLIHPSLIDNSPNTVCEAQVAGLPVIATDVGGVSSLIEDGINGMLCTNDIGNMKNKILALFDNNNFWNDLSVKSREMARKRHNKDNILQKTIETYSKVIN